MPKRTPSKNRGKKHQAGDMSSDGRKGSRSPAGSSSAARKQASFVQNDPSSNFEEQSPAASEAIDTSDGESAETQSAPRDKNSAPFLVVGVGASAGGYEAFSELLKNLPVDTEMAFVLVQHLDPTHESKLSELLSHATKMEVTEIRNETRLQPNHVYVIPPNRSLRVSKGVLQLQPRRRTNGPNLPIDTFFESLAHDQGNRAVGVILSGNGLDGTLGLKQIKAEGGITFVQDQSSAKFYGMPGNALHAGGVDFVLPPPGIARELARIGSYSPLRRGKLEKAEAQLPGEETDLSRIFGLLHSATRVDFSHYKTSTLKRRIARRMLLRKTQNLRSYLRYLEHHPSEVQALFNDILINVTGFFRDPRAFAALKKKVFPKILRQRPKDTAIRIWVPGCSTGEEVYSLAIALHEFLGKKFDPKAMQLFGTDISETMIGRARLGIYPENICSQVSPQRLRRYFSRTDGAYQIAKFIRDVCVFAKQNVAEDPPFSKVDLISCRNLLIYLGPVLQRKVLPVFHYSLRPGGYLLLGGSETIGSFGNLFGLVDKKNKIYSKLETESRPQLEFSAQPVEAPEAKPAKLKEEFPHFDLQRRADEILLSQFTPGGVVVNSRMEVLHFRGKTAFFFEPSPGTASLNLLKIVRGELVVEVRTAFAEAMKTNLPVRKRPIPLRYDGHYRDVALEVVPFKVQSSPERYFLVLFEDVPGVAEEENRRKARVGTAHQQSEREIRRLRDELAQTKESLQAIIEEQEATNEELKSANEEIQSSNEELQSTNEELETAKEELQSTNEELTTLNEELQNRNTELSQVNNDLNNLIDSFNMPLVMLGTDLTIRRFTPLAEKLFNLIPGDIGRRIGDINPNINISSLERIVSEVIQSLNTREMEVLDREGNWFSLRIRPYRTNDNKIEGAILVLVDIGDIRHGLDQITDMSLQPMLILNEESRVAKANERFYQSFGLAREETEGEPILAVGHGQWNFREFRALLDEVLPQQRRVENYRIEHEFPGLGRRSLLISARRLYQQSRRTHYIVMRFDDGAGK